MLKTSITEFSTALGKLARQLDMTYDLRHADYRPKVMITVSAYDHCLNLLLTKWRAKCLSIDIVGGVLSNHDACRNTVDWDGISFHHFPITPETKSEQESKILELFDRTDVELLVLVRYMQILSNETSERLAGRAINPHHSFLPGFKGARPHHQANERA
ncbi:formyltransferase family protein [Paraburkholderia sp.]|uniref:formyltransferase family protein n=1 Tax=Paraburkholderia sp. TaxID=1926495 RepID=UPI003C7976BA